MVIMAGCNFTVCISLSRFVQESKDSKGKGPNQIS